MYKDFREIRIQLRMKEYFWLHFKVVCIKLRLNESVIFEYYRCVLKNSIKAMPFFHEGCDILLE